MTTRNIIPQFQCHKELTGFIKLLAIQISADTCAESWFILVIFMTALEQCTAMEDLLLHFFIHW